MIEADEEQPGKMSKAEEAHSEAHMRTHKPFNPYCDICVRAKSRNKKGHKKRVQKGYRSLRTDHNPRPYESLGQGV